MLLFVYLVVDNVYDVADEDSGGSHGRRYTDVVCELYVVPEIEYVHAVHTEVICNVKIRCADVWNIVPGDDRSQFKVYLLLGIFSHCANLSLMFTRCVI